METLKQPLIVELEEGKQYTLFLQVHSVSTREDRRGNPFLNIELGDRSGRIMGFAFGVEEIPGAAVGKVLKVKGNVEKYNGKLNLKLSQWRLATEEEAAAAVPSLYRRSKEEPRTILTKILQEHIEPLAEHFPVEHAVLETIFQENVEALLKAGAASKLHHAYEGGLLEHILSLCDSVSLIGPKYQLDHGTMIALACLHDVGKIHELTNNSGVIEYTRNGALTPHIVSGILLVQRAFDREFFNEGIPQEFSAVDVRNRLQAIIHGIASHHGRLEDGSPVRPSTAEAIAFHFLDNLDSRMQMVAEEWEYAPADQDITTERHYSLGVRLVRFPSDANSED